MFKDEQRCLESMEEKGAHLGWGEGPAQEACELGLEIGILSADQRDLHPCVMVLCCYGVMCYCWGRGQVEMKSGGRREEVRLEGLPGSRSEGHLWVRRMLGLLEVEGRH